MLFLYYVYCTVAENCLEKVSLGTPIKPNRASCDLTKHLGQVVNSKLECFVNNLIWIDNKTTSTSKVDNLFQGSNFFIVTINSGSQ
jgi:hypothetical protein